MKELLNFRVVLLFLLLAQISFAQQKEITGNVTNTSGERLLGVNVIKKGTNVGVLTDIDGNYSINAGPEDTLEFSYLGLLTVERIVGNLSTINVVMQPDEESLGEIVVVAQGITAKPRELGYAIETVTGDEVTRSKEVNVVSALSAKTPGVSVTSSSGSVGASANIRIRGNSSIVGSNSPLFVVDGVPIDNSSTTEADGDGGLSGTDFSNRAVDLNSNDIESVTLLKGLAAQTLYGIRASNGVVLITTKKGKDGKTTASITSNTTFSQYNQVPDLQRTFSQGGVVGGQLTYRGPETFEGDSWGPNVNTLEYDGATDYPFDQNGRLVPAGTGNGQAANTYDHYDFFKTGFLQENNFSVSGGNENIRYRGSIGRLSQDGISPNEEFSRKTFRADIDADLDDKFSVNMSGQYTVSGGNRVQRGSNISGVMLGIVRATPTFDNGNGLSGQDAADNPNTYFYDIPGQELPGQRSYRNGIYNNPYFTVAENPNTDEVNRFIGKMGLNYQLTDDIEIRSAISVDQYTDQRKSGFNVIDASFGAGRVLNDQISNSDINWNIILNGSSQLSEDIGVSYTAGYDGYYTKTSRRIQIGDGFAIPGFFDISNSATQQAREDAGSKKLIGAFATATFSYDNFLYITPSFRNDWSSTLPIGDNSFQSYSVGASFVFTELMDDSDSFLDYGKLRLSYGSVGKDAPLFSTRTFFGGSFVGGDGFIQSVNFPAYDTVSFERSGVAGNPNLRPESTREFETGVELKMIDNRLKFDFTYYNRLSEDVILPVDVAPTSGFTSRVDNAAEISNKGVEIAAGYRIFDNEDFSWDIDANWTTYENIVESLAPGVEQITLNGFSSTSAVAAVGQPFSAIFGSSFQRDDAGNVLIGDDGFPIQSSSNSIVGDPTPDWLAGISNSIRYKDISLTFLFDIRKGGDIWCGTCGILDYFGTSARTLNREESRVFEGIVQSTGQPNTQSVQLFDTTISENNNFYRRYGFGGTSEASIYDGSWVRLRELTLSYNFPSRLLENTFIESATVSAYGRNLWLSTDYPGVDPETNLTGDSNGYGLDYFNQPNTKSYGLNLNLNF